MEEYENASNRLGENICKHISFLSQKALNGIYKENIKEINQLKSAKDVNGHFTQEDI